MLRVAVLALAALTLACYDPNPIDQAAVSPDGKMIAFTTAQGELGVQDLTGGPLTIYSHAASGGLAWSPDSRRLIFVESFPNAPSALSVLDLGNGGRSEEPLIRDAAWKGNPIWLSDDVIAYLTDTQADDVNIWTVSLKTHKAERLLDTPADVSRLWGNPRGGSFIFQSASEGELELWLKPEGAAPRQLTRDGSQTDLTEDRMVAYSPDGARVTLTSRREGKPELLLLGLPVTTGTLGAAVTAAAQATTTTVLGRHPLERPATSLTMLNDGRIAAGQGDQVLFWNPEAPWYRRKVTHKGWSGVPVRVISPWGPHGLLLAFNGNILGLTDQTSRLERSRLISRRLEDKLALANAYAIHGHLDPADQIVRQLRQTRPAPAPKPGEKDDPYLIDSAQAQLERLSHRWNAADRWQERAVQSAPPGSPELEAAWLERLALAVFGAQDRERVQQILPQLPPDAASAPLATWTRALLGSTDAELWRQWTAIGQATRDGQYDEASRLVFGALDRETITSPTLRGMSLLLSGQIEPLGAATQWDARHLSGLMNQPVFQLSLLQAIRLHRPQGPPPEELQGELLLQWVRQGDFSSARVLVRETLLHADAVPTEYLDMLRRYLVLDEPDQWQERAVAEVLLAEDIVAMFDRRLEAPDQRLLLRLAQTKKALVGGDMDEAQDCLDQAFDLVTKVTQAGDQFGTQPDDTIQRVKNLYTMRLFQAKIFERRGRWAETLQAYHGCLELMDTIPVNWDVAPNEVTFISGLIELGAARDPDLLESYLRLLRGIGDPLVNPTHDPALIRIARQNIETLRRVAPERWMRPYLTYTQGMGYSVLERAWPALDALGRAAADSMDNPSLHQRIVLEQAALRASLEQYDLAARLYLWLAAQPQPVSARAGALLGAIQAELACGLISSPGDRLAQLLKDYPLPRDWRDWLQVQLGAAIGPAGPPAIDAPAPPQP